MSSKLRYIESVVTLELNQDKCNGCGMCKRVCPHGVFDLMDGKAVLKDRGACMECGACAGNCTEGALDVRTGVGCAAGVIMGWINGTEPTCDCSGEGGSTCC